MRTIGTSSFAACLYGILAAFALLAAPAAGAATTNPLVGTWEGTSYETQSGRYWAHTFIINSANTYSATDRATDGNGTSVHSGTYTYTSTTITITITSVTTCAGNVGCPNAGEIVTVPYTISGSGVGSTAIIDGTNLTKTSETSSANPVSERQVLLDLYVSTNGANWTNNTGWNGPAGTECSWFGVICNSTHTNVININLPQNNLAGSLPSLNGLTALQAFGGNFNKLTGTIPPLNGLKALKSFYVIGNQFTGAIPQISGMTTLEDFWVMENQLTGTLPSLSGLPALKTFAVTYNQLTGTITELGGLTTLQVIGVGHNQFTGSIPPLDGLTALLTFHATDNQFTGSIPSLSSLTALQSFRVGHNLLTGTIPSLGGLMALQDFRAQDNQLSGTIPPLSGLTALQDFEVDNNRLGGPAPAPPASLPAYSQSTRVGATLCNNSLTSSGDPAIDAAWNTATGVDWLACQGITAGITAGIPAMEFYNSQIDHYFMTASTDEAVVLDNKPEWNWTRTGKTFNIWLSQSSAPGNASPVCRFFGVFANGTVGSHFYTVDATECDMVKGRLDWGWGYENDAFYAVKPAADGTCPSGTSPIYRAYNNGKSGAPNHRYMATQAEVDTMVSQGWVSEGTAFCGVQ